MRFLICLLGLLLVCLLLLLLLLLLLILHCFQCGLLSADGDISPTAPGDAPQPLPHFTGSRGHFTGNRGHSQPIITLATLRASELIPYVVGNIKAQGSRPGLNPGELRTESQEHQSQEHQEGRFTARGSGTVSGTVSAIARNGSSHERLTDGSQYIGAYGNCSSGGGGGGGGASGAHSLGKDTHAPSTSLRRSRTFSGSEQLPNGQAAFISPPVSGGQGQPSKEKEVVIFVDRVSINSGKQSRTSTSGSSMTAKDIRENAEFIKSQLVESYGVQSVGLAGSPIATPRVLASDLSFFQLREFSTELMLHLSECSRPCLANTPHSVQPFSYIEAEERKHIRRALNNVLQSLVRLAKEIRGKTSSLRKLPTICNCICICICLFSSMYFC